MPDYIEDLNDQNRARLEKLETMRAEGYDPFSVERYDRTHRCSEVLTDFDNLEGTTVRVAGRIVSLRLMGKAAFAHIDDGSNRLQIYLRKDDLGDDAYHLVKLLDVSDFIGVEGEVFRTKTGEESVHARSFSLLAKAIRGVPYGKSKDGHTWFALNDVETRYRHRYLDLLVNPDARKILLDRCRVVSETRRYLEAQGFLEVETPVLQSVAGGAAARPFTTHHNALDVDFHLRISLELYLKRLIVGNIEKVFEIGKVFRNEGMDRRHSPEYTLMELYQAYADLDDIMTLTENLVAHVCTAVNGAPIAQYDGHTVDFTPPWPRRTMLGLIEQYAGVQPHEFENLHTARVAMQRCGLPTEGEDSVGGIIEKLLERFVQPELINPTFVIDHPLETSPLAKKKPDNPAFTRRFEAYVCGQELANAFSELNDPIDQRERFIEQARKRAAGDEEAHPLDEDFLMALEYGMPPTGGLGIGMDRLAIIITGAHSIQDVILFPAMRPL